MVLAGIGLLAVGIYVGTESGTLKSWVEALGLDSVFDYVTAGMQLAGIALVAIGAMRGSLALVIAGAAILFAGIALEAVGEETLESWWETLKLTSVTQWVSAALLLAGIAMVAIGAMTLNLVSIFAGAAILGLGVIASEKDDRLESWVTTLGLNEVVQWVGVAITLLGIALIAFGIFKLDSFLLIAGAALIGAGVFTFSESVEDGDWVKALHLDDVSGKVTAAIMLAGIALITIGALMMNPLMILAGLGLLGAGFVANKLTGGGIGGVDAGSRAIPTVASYSVPHLAAGAVIPPNREFLAVLGDQRSGTNIEAPASEIEAAVARGIAQAGGSGARQITVVLELERKQFVRVVYDLNREEAQRVGVRLTGG